MKIQEVRHLPWSGFGGFRKEIRVRKLDKDEKLPVDAEVVPDDTPEHDWKEEDKN
jgi:hypothetical protein